MRNKLFNARLRTQLITALEHSWPLLLMAVGYGGAAVWGISITEQGEFISFATAFSTALVGLNQVAAALQHLFQTLPYGASVKPLLDFEPPPSEHKATPDLKGEIELSHVRLRYSPEAPEVLKGIDLKIKQGEYLGIVGASGSGKSSLIKVILGLQHASAGEILFDGIALSKLASSTLRRQIGLVMQSQELVPGSLLDNISGLRSISLKQAWRAAELAAIADDIRALPMGMYTMVNDAGDVFSGGQIQRIALARALAGEVPLLVLDEATSALDYHTQKLVCSNLAQLGNTRIVIAHRLTTVQHCDRIVVMHEGQCVESGKWSELANQNGVFAELLKHEMKTN